MNHWIKKHLLKKNKPFKEIFIGSVVKNIKTGTLMTVVLITTTGTPWGVWTEYTCHWFVGNKLHTDVFRRRELILEKQ